MANVLRERSDAVWTSTVRSFRRAVITGTIAFVVGLSVWATLRATLHMSATASNITFFVALGGAMALAYVLTAARAWRSGRELAQRYPTHG